MKIKLYNNRVKIELPTNEVTAYFKKHGVTLTFDIEQSNLQGLVSYHRVLSTNPYKERVLLSSVSGKFPPNDCDITMFAFNAEEFKPQEIPTGYCYFPGKPFIDISTHRNNPANYTFVEMCHELMHALTFIANQKGFNIPDMMDSYRENANPDSPTGNFATQWQLLKLFILSINKKPVYKYFKESEIINLKPELVQLLDKARDIAGVPFKITSGFRTPSQNAAVGGVPDSSHETGLAVDLAVANGVSGGKILLALAQVGFQRFGFYKDGHIHTDIDTGKPSPCYWIK